MGVVSWEEILVGNGSFSSFGNKIIYGATFKQIFTRNYILREIV